MASFQPLRFKSHILRSDTFNMHYIEVAEKLVKKMGGKFRLRLICTLNETERFHCGLQSLGNGKGLILVNNKRLKSLNLKVGDDVAVSLELDLSEFGMAMPEELNELLSQDEEGKRRFMMLTAGKQRNIIHYISSVKSQYLKIERAIKLIKNLKALPQGKETFRAILGMENK
jgi:hypothetical protein